MMSGWQHPGRQVSVCVNFLDGIRMETKNMQTQQQKSSSQTVDHPDRQDGEAPGQDDHPVNAKSF
jgi:hypothetical protein